MPFVSIKMVKDGDGATEEQKVQIIKKVTQVFTDVLGKDPAKCSVIIEELESTNWGSNGDSVKNNVARLAQKK